MSLASHRILNTGEAPAMLAYICNLARNPATHCVNKVFRSASERVATEVCVQIDMRDRTFAEKVERDLVHEFGEEHPPLEELFRTEYNKVLEQLEAIQNPNGTSESLLIIWCAVNRMHSEKLKLFRNRLTTLVESCSNPQIDESVRRTRMGNLFVRLKQLHANLVAWRQDIHNISDNDAEKGLEAIGSLLFNHLGEAISEESVKMRFQEAMRVRGKESSAAALCALHQLQKGAAGASPECAEAMRANGVPLTLEAFVAVERNLIQSQSREDETIMHLWDAITADFVGRGVVLANPPERTPEGVRGWINARENEPLLNGVRTISLQDRFFLPREIGKLSNLENLVCGKTLRFGPPQPSSLPPVWEGPLHLVDLSLSGHLLHAVPPFIERLHDLDTLDLSDGRIPELPPFLARLPHLRRLDVRGNPITRLPDALYRHLEPFWGFCYDSLETQYPNRVGSLTDLLFGDGRYEYGIMIDRENLTHIPFRLWFKETLTLPYLPFSPQRPFVDRLDIVAFVLLNFPMLLVNCILMNAIEPVVTLFRDLFGYDRLVPVEPQEIEAEENNI